MKKLILVAGAAAFAFAAPALAKPGNPHANRGNAHAAMTHGKVPGAMTHGKAHGAMTHGTAHGAMTHRNAHAAETHGKHAVAMRNGRRLYAFNARGSCPPGLAKKGNGCMPPGQAKKLFNVGQRYNRSLGTVWSYNQIPTDLRSRYSFDQNGRFYYSNGYLYQVDPRTMLVQQVVSLLLQ